MHKILVEWSDGMFTTSDEARKVTRQAVSEAAKSLGISEPNVEQFEARDSGPDPDAHYSEDFAQTTDAQAWAQAFMERFTGAAVGEGCTVDEGLMIGWFANAISVGERASRGLHHQEVSRDAGTGQFVTEAYAEEHPQTTVTEEQG